MAKFNMKDYEKYMKEEEKQDRLQAELEDKREEEALEADINWMRWQAERKSKEYEEQYDDEDFFDGWPELDYEDDDCYYPNCEDDYDYYDSMYDAYDPFNDLLDDEADVYRPTAEDLYDMYAYANEGGDCYPSEDEDSLEDELYALAQKFSQDAVEEECICRKAASRNRHHASQKAKKKAKESARILERRYWKGCFRLPYEEYRLATRASAAIKKANRVKSQTA